MRSQTEKETEKELSETLPFDIRSPEELQIHIPRMVRAGLLNVLSKTRNRFRVTELPSPKGEGFKITS